MIFLSQHCSGISRTRHYTPGWICPGCHPPTQPSTSNIPSSPLQTIRSTLVPRQTVVYSFSSSSSSSFPSAHSNSPSSVLRDEERVLGSSACQVIENYSTPKLVSVFCPSGKSPGSSASASSPPGPSDLPPTIQFPLALQSLIALQALIALQEFGHHPEQH